MKNKFSPRKSKNLFKGVQEIPKGFRAYITMYSAGHTFSKHIGCFASAKEAYDARNNFIDSLK